MDQDWLDTEIKLDWFMRTLVNIAVESAADSFRKALGNGELPIKSGLLELDPVLEKATQLILETSDYYD